MSDKRLDRMLPALSAKERAILMLRDYKAGKTQDFALLRSAPADQTAEINRLIGLMNAANVGLAHILQVVDACLKQEELRLAFLGWARICAMDMWVVRACHNLNAREVVTESEYQEREAAARMELLPIEELANIYTDSYHVFGPDDHEFDEDGDDVVSDEAWYRVRDGKVAEMKTAIASGALVSKGKGARAKVECGSFYDWIGEPVLVVPDVGIDFDVRPDAQAAEVQRARRGDADIREVLDRGACNLKLPLDMTAPLPGEPPASFGPEMALALALTIRSGLCANAVQLRAVEEKIDEFAAEFEGEDVLHPGPRERLTATKQLLDEVYRGLAEYTGPFEFPAPDDTVRALVDRIVEGELRETPMWG